MQDLERLLFNDKFQKRQKWYKLLQDPVWIPQFDIPLSAQRQKAQNGLKKVADSGLVSVKDFFNDATNIFTAHEMLGMGSASTTIKFTTHLSLFGGSIVTLHSQRHKHIFDKIDTLEVMGCFCLTELGYGSNTVMMETTATYDQKTKQFVINSPTVQSQKLWIANSAVYANYGLVFAQTIVKQKNEGINAFLVQLRDKNHKLCNNVQINDMGYKIGLNGIDNGSLKFHNVRIPQQNLMNRYCDISESGQFKHQVKGIKQRFFKAIQKLLSGRLSIAAALFGLIKKTTVITLRYSLQRKAVSANGKSQTPIFLYQLQQNELIPLISKTLALNMLHIYAQTLFVNQNDQNTDHLMMVCCVNKTLIGWHTERCVSIMRQRCGGQGFLAANMFGQAIASSHGGNTGQGDNKVLMVTVVKSMLKIYINNPEYFYNGEDICLSNKEDLFCLKKLSVFFQFRQKKYLEKLISKMNSLKNQGMSNFDILMFNTSDQIQQLAVCFGQKTTIRESCERLQLLKESKQIVKDYFIIFALEIIIRELGVFLLNGWIKTDLAQSLKAIYSDLIKKAAKNAQIVVSSFNVPEHALNVPIAKDYILYNSYANKGELINAKL